MSSNYDTSLQEAEIGEYKRVKFPKILKKPHRQSSDLSLVSVRRKPYQSMQQEILHTAKCKEILKSQEERGEYNIRRKIVDQEFFF